MITNLYEIEPRYDIELLAWVPLPKSSRTRCVGILLVRCNGKTGFLFARHVSRRSGIKLSYFEARQAAAKEQDPLDYVLEAFRGWLNTMPRKPGFEAVPIGLERIPQGDLLTIRCPFCGEKHSHTYWARANQPAGTRVSHCNLWGRSGREYRLPSQPFGNFAQNSERRWAIHRAEGVFRLTFLDDAVTKHLAGREGFNLDFLARYEPFKTLGQVPEDSTGLKVQDWGAQWVFAN
ncbi:MAG TPA: hypothetical protein EYO33_07250 [Phycisphaerales bacterium]|nr:hypothetical protein [Phycisphaerales bacterium]